MICKFLQNQPVTTFCSGESLDALIVHTHPLHINDSNNLCLHIQLTFMLFLGACPSVTEYKLCVKMRDYPRAVLRSFGHARMNCMRSRRPCQGPGTLASPAVSTLVTLDGHGVHVHTLPSLHVNHQGRSCDPISCEITVS